MAAQFRTEKDSMGEMKIPTHCLYGASTQRAVENFPISGWRFSREFIRVLAQLKSACAQENKKLGLLDNRLAAAILTACDAIAEGKYDEHFVVDVFQTGSGTSTNMNFNEVAANLANLSLGGLVGGKKPVHPNDHVNLGQSSNDVIPTAIHLAAALAVKDALLPALKDLHSTFNKKAKDFAKITKVGRTHLMDATPIRLGQEFSGYATQMKKAVERVERAVEGLHELAIGGTAVGTGINTHREFGARVARQMSQRLGIPFREADNHFEAQSSKDACVEFSGVLKTTAAALFKIANDIRLMASGPRAGLAEIQLPETQPGSSIMPGKVNPVSCEALLQVCCQVIGNDAAITWGGANGNFELNTMMPLIGHNLLCSIHLMANAVRVFDEKCASGIEANEKHLKNMLDRSLMMVTALVPLVGYDKAAEIAKKAHAQNKTIRQVASEMKDLPMAKIEALLDADKMTKSGASSGGGSGG